LATTPVPSISEQLVEEFGANASYAELLLERFLANPGSIDESWRNYFSELVSQANGSAPVNDSAPVVAKEAEVVAEIPKPEEKQKVEEKSSAEIPGAEPMTGGIRKIVQNMEASLGVPTATSVRMVPVKLLDENRRLINQYLEEQNASSSQQTHKVSFTHLIAWALLRALSNMPQMNDGFVISNGAAARLPRPDVNLGIAIDMTRKDGTRTLLVPNIKRANAMSFAEFHHAYDDIISRARSGKLDVADFEGTTISLTNPGTIGTVGSVPRLMSGQSLILATGAIEYPAEYQGMSPEALAQLGIGKVVQISSTYDHRVIQGAESGALLQAIHELLLGQRKFYEQVFEDLSIPYKPMVWSVDKNAVLGDRTRAHMSKQARVLELINSYRVRGHLMANIDPLHAMPMNSHPDLEMENYGLTIWDLDREFITGGFAGVESATLRAILEVLRRSYCGTVGVEYRHILSKEEKTWLRARIEREAVPVPVEIRKQILWKLISAEQFERFLHNNFLGQKRFSVEGCETIIPLLDQLIEGATERGVKEIVLGMAHRGRLNVLANVLGHFCERIFASFIGSVHPNFPADEGDVKYHQGAKASRETNGNTIDLTLSPNPSHLEFVDAVVEGMARAKQDLLLSNSLSAQDGTPLHPTEVRVPVWSEILPVLLHGDAAFAGQGIVMETLNLFDLKGYRTGGTIHIIVNNQIGFTTGPESGRSTIYSTDVARMTQIPIFHINGDDPDAAHRTLQIALDFRKQFHKDVVLDVVGFRRLGHNEADEPSYTQPLMYQRVKAHPGVREIYGQKLIKEGIVTEDEVKGLIEDRVAKYNDALDRAKTIATEHEAETIHAPSTDEEDGSPILPTQGEQTAIQAVTDLISIIPKQFHLHPKMVGQLARRAKMGAGTLNMDWAFAEAMAFGSLVLEGTSVRLSGQDSGRGTFSQRHAVLYDIESGEPWCPLSSLSSRAGAGKFEVFDSSLSEQGVLGFEYGYSVIAEKSLTLWEAQFGDFANGAQVIIDQFIASGEDKWQQLSRLVLLLPHGYEGQGPEHSSARLERYLQLCGQNNMQVANPTTPAQYFHLLRRQMKQNVARPLVVMTPKSLLRLPAASSPVDDLFHGGFVPVLDDGKIADKSAVDRIVICSGKVYYDILEARESGLKNNVALIRLEQLYPYPKQLLRDTIAQYPNAKEVLWAQEEPKNMGGWAFVKPRLLQTVPELLGEVRYVGRARSASPSTGFYAVHKKEQQDIVSQALN
jgi:2-oxoglutarate dehydrogenase E1 component